MKGIDGARPVSPELCPTDELGGKKSVIVLCFVVDTSVPTSFGTAATCSSCCSAEATAGTASLCDWLKTQKVLLPVCSSDTFSHSQYPHRSRRDPGHYIPLSPSRKHI